MAVKRQTFNNGTQGDEITAANSGTSGDALSTVVKAGTGMAVYSAVAASRGIKGAHVTGILNDTFTITLSNTSLASGSAQLYFRIVSYPTANGAFFRMRSSIGNVCIFHLNTTGVLALQNSSGSTLKNFNSNTALSLGITYRVQLQATPNASISAGFIAGQLYSDSGTLIDSYASWAVDAGTTLNVQTAQTGKPVSSSDAVNMYIDELAFDTDVTTEIPPVPVIASLAWVSG